jgi:hypothetical protein
MQLEAHNSKSSPVCRYVATKACALTVLRCLQQWEDDFAAYLQGRLTATCPASFFCLAIRPQAAVRSQEMQHNFTPVSCVSLHAVHCSAALYCPICIMAAAEESP